MLELFSRYWWTVALRGVLAVVFGAVALIWPAITVGVLVLLYLIATCSRSHSVSRWRRWACGCASTTLASAPPQLIRAGRRPPHESQP